MLEEVLDGGHHPMGLGCLRGAQILMAELVEVIQRRYTLGLDLEDGVIHGSQKHPEELLDKIWLKLRKYDRQMLRKEK